MEQPWLTSMSDRDSSWGLKEGGMIPCGSWKQRTWGWQKVNAKAQRHRHVQLEQERAKASIYRIVGTEANKVSRGDAEKCQNQNKESALKEKKLFYSGSRWDHGNIWCVWGGGYYKSDSDHIYVSKGWFYSKKQILKEHMTQPWGERMTKWTKRNTAEVIRGNFLDLL